MNETLQKTLGSELCGNICKQRNFTAFSVCFFATYTCIIPNPAIGGLISGITSSAKGQDGSSMSASGVISTKEKGAKSLLSDGALTGASNAGDKIADYYLRQAEAMSPVLTVPSGVRVNAQITKGFFVGEMSTHRKINQARGANPNNVDANIVRAAKACLLLSRSPMGLAQSTATTDASLNGAICRKHRAFKIKKKQYKLQMVK
ncbi:hypothetical protein PsorP6_006356 [Peronosclerospora sorghi]|uniref:Uncharacterized protein n=1 Tax=Peronosclerospora sorghi TaxID=230839 RepID=A0ACC0W2N3_9STRA|nr:hypothetical protein PsorP6_006356 [Peronosclerospora sorghi]